MQRPSQVISNGKIIDKSTYDRLDEDKRFYIDYTGTGNTLYANRN